MDSKFVRNRGFTLVELLVVIAIIGILVTIAVIAINPVRVIQNTQDTKRRTELNQIKTSLQLYYNDYKKYPTTAQFTHVGSAGDFTNTYMKKLPIGYPYYYGTDASQATYAVGVDLNNQSAAGNDSNSWDKCGTDVGLLTDGTSVNLTPATTDRPSQKPAPGNSDYFVCPD